MRTHRKFLWRNISEVIHTAGTTLNITTFLFGPRFERRGKNVIWLMQSLYGFSSIKADGDVFGPEIGRFDSSFAFAPASGGIDLRLSEKFAFRVFQYDLIFTSLGRDGKRLALCQLNYQTLLRRRISTASGSERPLAKAALATARGTDPVDTLQNNLA